MINTKNKQMKNLALYILGLMLVLTSCDQDNIGTIYEPGNAYVAFSSSIVPEYVLSADDDYSISVQIARSDLSGATTANITLEMNDDIEGVFELESSTVTFADGEATVNAKIVPLVDASELDPAVTFVFKLTLTGDNVSPLFNTTTYKASFKYTSLGAGDFVSEAWGEEWSVDVQMLEVGSLTIYKLKDLYEDGYDVTIMVTGDVITIAPQPAWYYDDELGDAYIQGSGTVSGNVFSMTIEHYLPDEFSYGDFSEILTLP